VVLSGNTVSSVKPKGWIRQALSLLKALPGHRDRILKKDTRRSKTPEADLAVLEEKRLSIESRSA